MLTKELTLLFRKYIALNTSLPSGENYPQAILLLQSFITTCGFTSETVKIPESVAGAKNRVHLIARRFTHKSLPTLLIYNHIDTVPANYENAFKLIFKEDKVYGRGTSDHKGSTLAVLDALKNLKNKHLRFNIIFLASTDEETNQLPQLDYITPILKLPKNTIAFDPDTFAGGISVAHVGQLGLEITVHGRSVHSGMSHLGINAIEEAYKVIGFFLKIKKEFEVQHSKFHTFPNKNTVIVSSRCNVTMIESGTAINVIPDTCKLMIDCRFIPELDTVLEEKKLFDRSLEFFKTEGIDADIKVLTHIHGYASDHPLVHELNLITKSITGEGGSYAVMGSTPLAHWSKRLSLPHFGIGVARFESRIHGVNEFAYVKDLEQLSLILQKFFV